MKRLALTQAALNFTAKTPEGRALLRRTLKETEERILTSTADFKAMIGEAEGLAERIRIALGEVAA